MRYLASERPEITRLVEHLLVRRNSGQTRHSPFIFYRWYGAYQAGGQKARDDQPPLAAVRLLG